MFRRFRRWLTREPKTFLRASNASKSTKDFSWHLRKENPFDHPKKNWKFKTIITLGLLAGISTPGLLLYHPFFRLRDIHITGIERIDHTDFLHTVSGILASKKFLLLPGDSYLTADLDDLHTILSERFPLQSVAIQKKFPHSLRIEIEEKISTIIYDDGKTYAYLGLDGNVLETIRRVGENEWTIKKEITTSTRLDGSIAREEKIIERIHIPPVQSIVQEMGEYPIVYHIKQTSSSSTATSTPLLANAAIGGIISWYQKLTHESNIPVGYFFLGDRDHEGVIHTRLGWQIKAIFDDTVPDQFERLMMMIKKHGPNNPASYVDVRYPGRVYWK